MPLNVFAMTCAELAGEMSRRYGKGIYHAAALCRASVTLSTWAEKECGNGNDYASWAIERDETTGKPYLVTYPHDFAAGDTTNEPIADRERGALRRIGGICERLGLHYYHQTDPRGCALYVSREPLTDTNYSGGVACCVEG